MEYNQLLKAADNSLSAAFSFESYQKIMNRLMSTVGIKISPEPANIGCSKFGGHPDVSNNFKWPKKGVLELTFLAQINLSEIGFFKAWENFPKQGILYFFMTTYEDNYYEKQENFRVVYESNTSKLKRLFHESNGYISSFEESTMQFYEHLTLRTELEYNDDFDDTLSDAQSIIDELNSHNGDGGNQLLGNPFDLQTPVKYVWAAAEANYNWENIPVPEDLNELFERNGNKFALVLQIDFGDDDNPSFGGYGGNGICYFGIRRQNLIEGDFSKLYGVFQMT